MFKFILPIFLLAVSSVYGQSSKFPKVDDKATFEKISKKYESLPTNKGGLIKKDTLKHDSLVKKFPIIEHKKALAPKKTKTKTTKK